MSETSGSSAAAPAVASSSTSSSSSPSLPWVLQPQLMRWAFWSCALVVLVLSLLPGERMPLPTTGWDKADHFLAYAVMAALGRLAWSGRTWVLLISLLVFGIVIEGLQAMTGYRSAELRDVYAEGLGVCVGAAVAWGVVWTLGGVGRFFGGGGGAAIAPEGAPTKSNSR